MTKKVLAVLAVLSLIPIVVLIAGCGGLPKSAVAQVDGEPITKQDLDKAISLYFPCGQGVPDSSSPEYQQLQQQAAQFLVNNKVVEKEAESMGITVTDDQINQQIDQFKQMTGGEDQFNQTLDQKCITLPDLKDEVRTQMLQQQVLQQITKDVPQMTDQQAQDYYNQNQAQFQKPETRQVRGILVTDPNTAQTVKAQLDGGADFAALAKQYSTDTSTKDNGGSFGEIASQGSGMVPPEFEQAMDQLAAGQVSAPVKSQNGWYIIKVDAINPPRQMTFDEVKDQIESTNAQTQQQQVAMDWLNQAMSRHEIIYADDYNPSNTTAAGSSGAGATDAGQQPAAPGTSGAQPAPAPAPGG